MVKVLGSPEPDSPAPLEGEGAEEAVGVASAATEVAAEGAAEVVVAAVGVAVAVPLLGVVGAGVEEPEPPVHRAGPGMLYLMVAA